MDPGTAGLSKMGHPNENQDAALLKPSRPLQDLSKEELPFQGSPNGV